MSVTTSSNSPTTFDRGTWARYRPAVHAAAPGLVHGQPFGQRSTALLFHGFRAGALVSAIASLVAVAATVAGRPPRVSGRRRVRSVGSALAGSQGGSTPQAVIPTATIGQLTKPTAAILTGPRNPTRSTSQ
jgi:hypothetical protein